MNNFTLRQMGIVLLLKQATSLLVKLQLFFLEASLDPEALRIML